MRVLKHVVIGLLVFTLMFLFLPTGQDGNAVVDNFQATTSYATTFKTSGAQLVAPYVDTEEEPDNIDSTTSSSSSTVVSQVGYIYCDEDGNGLDCYVNSHIDPNRKGSPHTGEDLIPNAGFSAFSAGGIYAVCPFDGTVKSAGYDTSKYSAGYNVTVQITEHLDITYMHLGYGAGRAVQYSSYTTPQALIASYPFQGVGYPDEWVNEQTYCSANGKTWHGLNRWIGPSSIRVAPGDVITAGTIIGVPGDTGNSTGMHAHFRLRYTEDNGTKWVGSIKEVLDGTSIKDLTWMRTDGKTYTTAEAAGWDLQELDIRVAKEVSD